MTNSIGFLLEGNMSAKACLVLLGFLLLSCRTGVVSAQAAREAGPIRVVYLEKSPHWTERFGKLDHRDLLSQEIVRQALLVAARDELGLTTRDAWLGDPMPARGDNPPLEVEPGAKVLSELEILRGFPGSQAVIAHAKIRFPHEASYPEVIAVAERLSRSGFVEALKQAGFRGKPHARKADAKAPEEVERLLAEMAFTSQFQAIRALHQAMHVAGESASLLGALTRGYANLGMLTEFYWHPAHDVFTARALLYAHRMASRDKSSNQARWHKAYAFALAGLPAAALSELKEASEAADKGDTAIQPAWVDLIAACCRHDLKKLDPGKAPERCVPLARLLTYRALELEKDDRAMEAAKAGLREMPDCYRLHEGICQFGGVAVLHEGTSAGLVMAGRKLYARVGAMPDLPEEARLIVQARAAMGRPQGALSGRDEGPAEEFKVRAKLVSALLATGQVSEVARTSDDRGGKTAADGKPAAEPAPAQTGEPSWAALGCLIRELSFVQVWRRAKFERYELSTSPDEFLSAAEPLVKEHPYRVFLATHAWDREIQKKAREELAKISPEGIELQALPLCIALAGSAPEKYIEWGKEASRHAPATERDLGLLLESYPDTRPAAAWRLLRISPYSPMAKFCLITFDWKNTEKLAAEWEKQEAGHGAVLSALGQQYSKLGRLEDAERCLKAAIEASPVMSHYGTLAEFYQEHGKMDQWVATMEKMLDLPDYGLYHARIRASIAGYYINHRQWQKARPYAEGAAQSYSAWGLECASDCYEGLQQWEEAEQMLRAEAERYRGHELGWYYFCKRTGQGDLESARELARKAIESPDEDPIAAAAYWCLENQPAKALPPGEKALANRNDPYDGLFVALLADELKENQRRDAALQQVVTKGPGYRGGPRNEPRPELVALGTLMAGDLARGGKGEIDVPAAEKAASKGNADEQMRVWQVLAKYLDLHGHPEQAIRLWKKCIATARFRAFPYTVAAFELLRHGVRLDQFKVLLQQSDPLAPQTK
jgi:tetratricopeptide (TPR) repeat protein